ncbi:hypothetical protein TRFO_16229 [Tritrichomonas foetus]|uniref:Intimal thickness related receptor IRP domain-containing protein n=1 Tax=Tritrichomonas foetus TaxID=1144522 RepID=A0A1J4KVF3_9EUKA|nr:hypothetical protein TRFO_16229 [Tritrichomonas foetus]|eukprot:OHT13493.1 hypothetical protein TRFO_16229 [Tritrichomonas foetus]
MTKYCHKKFIKDNFSKSLCHDNQIMLFLFLFFSSSKKISHRISPQSLVTALPEYGFQRGGRLHITLFSVNFTGVKLFMLTPMGRDIFYRPNNYGYFCTSKADFILGSARPKVKESSIGTWSIEIRNKSIYMPIITNCNGYKMTTIAQFSNPNNFLDFREQNILIAYIAFSFCYVSLFIIWIFNGFLYPSFYVKLHFLFAASCLLKAASLTVCSIEWKIKQIHEDIENKICFIIYFMKCLSFIFLITINVLASNGLSTYNDASSVESVSIAVIAANMYISLLVCENKDPAFSNFVSFAAFFTIVTYFCITRFINNGIAFAYTMYDIFDHLHTARNIIQKANLLIEFNYTFLTIFSFTVSIDLFTALCELPELNRVLFKEVIEIFIFFVDLFFFTYRNSYIPDDYESNNQSERENLPPIVSDFDIVTLEEPNNRDIHFLFLSDMC